MIATRGMGMGEVPRRELHLGVLVNCPNIAAETRKYIVAEFRRHSNELSVIVAVLLSA